MDNELRDQALEALQRLIPAAHYYFREGDPKADRELVEPLLQNPSYYRMTSTEKAAARALESLAWWQLEYRKIHDEVFPARDIDDPRDAGQLSEDQVNKLLAIREVFREKALTFARQVKNDYLVEHYVRPPTAPTAPGCDDEPTAAEADPPGCDAPTAQSTAMVGIATAEIIERFRLGAPWAEKLRKASKDKYQYLLPARKQQGRPGGDSHRWNPAKLGKILVEKKERNHRAVSEVIYHHFPAWADDWDALPE